MDTLHIRGLHKCFGDKQVLTDLNQVLRDVHGHRQRKMGRVKRGVRGDAGDEVLHCLFV